MDSPKMNWGVIPKNSNSTIVVENTNMHIAKNDIFFYNNIDSKSAVELNVTIKRLEKELICSAVCEGREPAPIRLHINSMGGFIADGISILETIQSCGVPVHTIVEGTAASAATFFSIVGDKRYIHRNSYMLIHQLSGGFWGNYEQIKDELENKKQFMSQIKQLYKKYTKIPQKELDEILKHDLWFNAEKCLKYKLVDEII